MNWKGYEIVIGIPLCSVEDHFEDRYYTDDKIEDFFIKEEHIEIMNDISKDVKECIFNYIKTFDKIPESGFFCTYDGYQYNIELIKYFKDQIIINLNVSQ